MSNVCKTCNGKGQTRETATVMTKRKVENKGVVSTEFTTKHLGSGCPDCLGRGVIERE